MPRVRKNRRIRRRVPIRRRSIYRRRLPIRRRPIYRRRFPIRSRRRTLYLGSTALPKDRAIFVAKNELQFNSKQAAADFGTSVLIPGNYLPDILIPGLVAASAQYNNARILRSSISVRFTNVEATHSKSVGITQLPINDTSGVTPTVSVYLSEQPRTKSAYLSPLSGSSSARTVSMVGSTAADLGNSTASTSAGDILTGMPSGLLAAPQTAWQWNVWTQNVSGAGTLEAGGTNYRIITRHYIEFFDRIAVTQ